jgi:hypothetical protein
MPIVIKKAPKPTVTNLPITIVSGKEERQREGKKKW